MIAYLIIMYLASFAFAGTDNSNYYYPYKVEKADRIMYGTGNVCKYKTVHEYVVGKRC